MTETASTERLEEAMKRCQEALNLHDAEVANELASEGERADLWTDIDVLVDDLRTILSALASRTQEPAEWQVEKIARVMFATDWPNDDWDRFKPGDVATNRYRAMARAALRAATPPAPERKEDELRSLLDLALRELDALDAKTVPAQIRNALEALSKPGEQG